MPKGGHNKKPLAQKLIEGAHVTGHELRPIPVGDELSSIPPAPPILGEEGVLLWDHLCHDFIVSGLLQTVDLPQLQILVHNVEQYWKIQNIVKELPDFYAYDAILDHWMYNEEGEKAYKTYTRQGNALLSVIVKMAQSFGMSPSARNSLMLTPKTDEGKDVAYELIG